jgi:crossover junction endodeoxyribonuclease RuvC
VKILGVDPGLSGAYALLGDVPPLVTPFPRAGKGLDLAAIADDWRTLAPDLVVMESVHAMPKQGVTGVFTFGRGFGALEGIAAALGFHVELVTPQAWKKVILAGTAKDKDAAVAWCRRAYPGVTLVQPRCRMPHDGCADALCIAAYGLRVQPRAVA